MNANNIKIILFFRKKQENIYMYEHLTEITYIKGYEQELREQEDSLTAFSFATQVPVTFFSPKGTVLWECNGDTKICKVNRSYGREDSECMNVLRSAMSVSDKLGEVYIFECFAGLIKICFPLVLGRKNMGYYVAGPILMGNTKSRSLKNFYRKAPLEDVDFPSLAVILNELSFRTPKEVNYISMIFYNSLMSYLIKDRQSEKYRQLNRERSETVTKIIQMKEDRIEVRYPGEEENQLIKTIESGDTEAAERELSKYIEGIMVFDAGNLQVVKVRLLNLFSRLFSPESHIEEDFSSLGMIENIGNAEDFKTLFMYSRDFVVSACEIISSGFYSGRSRIVSQAIKIINRSFSEDLNLTRVAGEIHVNPSYLSALFNREMGCSFIAFLTDVRLKKAADLLEETDESIQEIAYSCGFREPNYFSRVFRKKYGRSPRESRSR